MDILNIKKGLFAIKDQPNPELKLVVDEITKDNKTDKDKVTYNEYGFLQASRLGGTMPGLNTCLHKIYQEFKQEIKDDNAKQDELKRPFRIKIEEYKGEIDGLERKIDRLKLEYIPRAKNKIETLKSELSNIRKNPQQVTGDDAGKASFFIGSVILIFLTIYLFIFYSSATYSAFFKEFSLNEIGVANSIFDAKALTKAFKDGFTELALILTIPFVFVGLGYLIHKFQEQKGKQKYLKISMLILVTFIFDSILAYEITEKIYDIKKQNSFTDIPEYTVSMAFHSINFWLIIFAGFIVYLIWGFVFDFVMESFSKIDKVKIALQEKDKQIVEAEIELSSLEKEQDDYSHKVDGKNTEINKLKKILESSIIPREFEHDIFSFLAGWLAWMKQSGKQHQDLVDADLIAHEFVKITLRSVEIIN